jgi:hypothetical protein
MRKCCFPDFNVPLSWECKAQIIWHEKFADLWSWVWTPQAFMMIFSCTSADINYWVDKSKYFSSGPRVTDAMFVFTCVCNDSKSFAGNDLFIWRRPAARLSRLFNTDDLTGDRIFRTLQFHGLPQFLKGSIVTVQSSPLLPHVWEVPVRFCARGMATFIVFFYLLSLQRETFG